MDELFDYLKQNSNLKNLKHAEENYEYRILKKLKEDLASIFHDEIKNVIFPKKPEVLEDLKIFRRLFSLHDYEENNRINETLRQCWLQRSDESELISTFLSELDLDKHKVQNQLWKLLIKSLNGIKGRLEVRLKKF